jgi:predicted metal-dependent phosphoesterase TrpH
VTETIRVDFHVHTAASFDSSIEPERLVELVPARGLDGIAVTDHNSVESGLALAALEPPFLVVVGEEIDTAEGEVVGLFLTERIEPGLSPEETVARIRRQGGVAYVPHPFDRYRSSAMRADALARIAGEIDAVEGHNARNIHAADDRAALAWAREQGVPLVAGSDCHTEYEIGRAFAELPAFSDAQGLRAALPASVPHVSRSHPGVHVVTKVRKLRGKGR